MKQSSTNPSCAEFWRAAAPAAVCVAVMLGTLVLVPACSAVLHAYAKMDAERHGTPLSVLDMTPEEKAAIMTRHHLKLLADLQAQFAGVNARTREARRLAAGHPSPANQQTMRVCAQCRGYLIANYNDIAAQTPASLLDHARLPRELP